METEHDQVSRILKQQLQLALQRRKQASIVLGKIWDDPAGLSTDSAERIQNASRELSAALEALTLAVKRRTDYLLTKIPPDDLKFEP